MSGQIAVELPARRQPLLTIPMNNGKISGGSHRGSRMGETAGECAAVCCCCPCGMMHLIILAVYRLPTGLWRKNKRQRLLRKKRKNSSSEESVNQRKKDGDDEELTDWRGVKNDVVDWENEMLDRFYGAGFWRSASQRSDYE